MKVRTVVAVAMLTAMAGEAVAQTPPAAHAGSLVITDRRGADCNSVNAQVGELHTGVFRPVQVGVPAASLTLLQAQVAMRIVPEAGGNFAETGVYLAQMITGRAGFREFTGNYSRFRIRPNPPTATTPIVDISGKLSNFKGAADCTVTFAGSYVLKPAND